MTDQPEFCCNLDAFTASERGPHKALTDKLIAARNQITEIPDGYEFRFDPKTISITELASWAAAEGKCCPFFDFQIAMLNRGAHLTLRLTGDAGVKPFIQQEFSIPNV